MKAFIFILVAVQIVYSSGQSLDQAIDDAIDQLNEDSTVNNLVAVVKQVNVKSTLKSQGLMVKLKLHVKETNCSKDTTQLFPICEPEPQAEKRLCTFVINYENCELKTIEINQCEYFLPDETDVSDIEGPFNLSSNSSVSAGSDSD